MVIIRSQITPNFFTELKNKVLKIDTNIRLFSNTNNETKKTQNKTTLLMVSNEARQLNIDQVTINPQPNEIILL